MSVIFMDGFEIAFDDIAWYANRYERWGTGIVVSGTGPRTGDGCLTVDSDQTFDGSHYLTHRFDSGVTELYVGFGFYIDAITDYSINNKFNFFSLVGDTEQESMAATLVINSSDQLEIWIGDSVALEARGTLIDTSTNTFSTGQWYFVDIHFVLSATVGEFEVKVDGISWASGSSIDTTDENTEIVGMMVGVLPESSVDDTHSVGAQFRFDDLSVHDTNGSFANSWVNGNEIRAIVCDGSNGDYTDFSYSGGGDGPTNVADLVSFGNYVDAAYAYNSGSGDQTWGLTAPTGDGSVNGVMLLAYTECVYPGAVDMAMRFINTNGEHDTSTFKPKNFSWNYEILATDPNTGNQFILSELGSAQLGVSV